MQEKKRKGAKAMKKRWLFILLLSLFTANLTLAQTKTVTNADLEKFKQKRVQEETKYRKNYKRLGLSSPEEIEKQNEQRRREFEQLSDQLKAQRQQTKNSILERADILNSEIASIDAQINYLRGQIGNSSSSSQTVIYPNGYQSYGYVPYGNRSFRSTFRQRQSLPTNAQTVQDYTRMYPNSNDLYNRSTGNYAYQNQRLGRFSYGRRGYYRSYGTPIIVDNGNYTQNDLNSQLIYLEQQRAGLLAQWQLLEEEARRAGVKID